jgi:hypothetical protein
MIHPTELISMFFVGPKKVQNILLFNFEQTRDNLISCLQHKDWKDKGGVLHNWVAGQTRLKRNIRTVKSLITVTCRTVHHTGCTRLQNRNVHYFQRKYFKSTHTISKSSGGTEMCYRCRFSKFTSLISLLTSVLRYCSGVHRILWVYILFINSMEQSPSREAKMS